MKNILVLLMTFALGTNVYSQGGFGGGRGFGGPGGRGGPPSGARGEFNPQEMDDTPVLENFPEIPGITLEQRADVGKILGDEHKSVRKLESQKMKLFQKEREATDRDEKNFAKNRKKIAKIDEKIRKQIEKSNKKIAKKLTAEQYQIFLEKRQEFRFNSGRPPMMPRGEKGGTPNGMEGMPPRGQRPMF
jgi:hypothetical protein